MQPLFVSGKRRASCRVQPDERRGFAVSMNALSMQVPMALRPTFAGALIGAGWFIMPFYVAAALQGLYVFLYGRVFASFEQAAMAGNDN